MSTSNSTAVGDLRDSSRIKLVQTGKPNVVQDMRIDEDHLDALEQGGAFLFDHTLKPRSRGATVKEKHVFYDIDPKKNGGGDGGEMVEGDVE
ncbi:hypothetical protein Tco_0525156 [Tanacetum coccineum]